RGNRRPASCSRACCPSDRSRAPRAGRGGRSAERSAPDRRAPQNPAPGPLPRVLPSAILPDPWSGPILPERSGTPPQVDARLTVRDVPGNPGRPQFGRAEIARWRSKIAAIRKYDGKEGPAPGQQDGLARSGQAARPRRAEDQAPRRLTQPDAGDSPVRGEQLRLAGSAASRALVGERRGQWARRG